MPDNIEPDDEQNQAIDAVWNQWKEPQSTAPARKLPDSKTLNQLKNKWRGKKAPKKT